jgi:hypothetical protein
MSYNASQAADIKHPSLENGENCSRNAQIFHHARCCAFAQCIHKIRPVWKKNSGMNSAAVIIFAISFTVIGVLAFVCRTLYLQYAKSVKEQHETILDAYTKNKCITEQNEVEDNKRKANKMQKALASYTNQEKDPDTKRIWKELSIKLGELVGEILEDDVQS